VLKVLPVVLLILSPTIALAQEYQPQPYDPQSSDSTSGATSTDGTDAGLGTGNDATNSYGIPNADNTDICCGETSPQPGGASGDGSADGSSGD
jgi:hypothetical protein